MIDLNFLVKTQPILSLCVVAILLELTLRSPFAALVRPFRKLTVLTHEYGHLAGCVLTGGKVRQLVISEDLHGNEGTAFCSGGLLLFYVNTGYLGAVAFGCFLLATSSVPSPRTLLIGSFALMTLMVAGPMLRSLLVKNMRLRAFTSLLWLLLLVFCAALAMPLIANQASARVTIFALGAVHTSLSVRAIFTLISLCAERHKGNDAAVMGRLTRTPAMLWALLWLIMSLAMILITLDPNIRAQLLHKISVLF